MATRNTHVEKSWIHEITTWKNLGSTKYPREFFWTVKIPTRKNFAPTKYPREKKLAPRNIYEKIFCIHETATRKKFRTHEISTRTNFRPTKYPREYMRDLRNTHEKKCWTHKTPSRKNFGITKYSWENILDPRNTNEKKFWTHKSTMARWHKTHETQDDTWPKEFSAHYKHKKHDQGAPLRLNETFNTIKNMIKLEHVNNSLRRFMIATL